MSTATTAAISTTGAPAQRFGRGMILLMLALYFTAFQALGLSLSTLLLPLVMSGSGTGEVLHIALPFGSVAALAVAAIVLAHRRDARFPLCALLGLFAAFAAAVWQLPLKAFFAGVTPSTAALLPAGIALAIGRPAVTYLSTSPRVAAWIRPGPVPCAPLGGWLILLFAWLFLILGRSLYDVTELSALLTRALAPTAAPPLLAAAGTFAAWTGVAALAVHALALGFDRDPRFPRAAAAAFVAPMPLALMLPILPIAALDGSPARQWIAALVVIAVGALAIATLFTSRRVAATFPKAGAPAQPLDGRP
jgi:hypothetical protein